MLESFNLNRPLVLHKEVGGRCNSSSHRASSGCSRNFHFIVKTLYKYWAFAIHSISLWHFFYMIRVSWVTLFSPFAILKHSLFIGIHASKKKKILLQYYFYYSARNHLYRFTEVDGGSLLKPLHLLNCTMTKYLLLKRSAFTVYILTVLYSVQWEFQYAKA